MSKQQSRGGKQKGSDQSTLAEQRPPTQANQSQPETAAHPEQVFRPKTPLNDDPSVAPESGMRDPEDI